MAYLGRGIENLSDRVVLDDITTSATATYNLTLNSVAFVPSSSESLTCSLNGVVQKSGGTNPSFTVSGSQIIFSSALTSSDSIDFIIAERGITLQTPSAGSVNTDQLAANAVTTAKITDANITTAKIANDAVTKDKVLNLMYPAFEAISDSNQTVTDNTYTKVSLQTEILDTDNNFDNSSGYRFTPTTAGKYYIEGQVRGSADGNDRLRNVYAAIYKNGSLYKESRINFHGADITLSVIQVSAIVDMNGSSDYVELFGAVDTTTGTVFFNEGTKSVYFLGYRIGD